MTVLVDIGNTRIKWATLANGRLVRRGSAVHRDSLDASVAAFAAELPARPRIIAANVAGERVAERLAALVAARPGASLELVATSAERFGVRCAYADPSRLGVDRWVAVLAAYHAARGAACAIDAGTAVTFDAVDGTGAHLGGLIFPGARLARVGARPQHERHRPHGAPRLPWLAGSTCSAATPTPPSGTPRGSRCPQRSIAPSPRSSARSARGPSCT